MMQYITNTKKNTLWAKGNPGIALWFYFIGEELAWFDVDGAAAEINMLATVYSCFSERRGGKGTYKYSQMVNKDR